MCGHYFGVVWKDRGQRDQEWEHFKAELKFEITYETEPDLEVYVFSTIIDIGYLILLQLFRSGSYFWAGFCIIEDVYGTSNRKTG